jgi:G6PDH family F420-dependent oxidoreductase
VARVWCEPDPGIGKAVKIGYFLSSEEYTPAELLDQARRAEQSGFDALWISDHFHPWNDEQGQSPFVWSMIGAIAQVCTLPLTTAVTCPTTRIHPVITAQAAATSAVLLDGRFRLGVGTGEALNEHVTGARWPSIQQRLEQLEEAVEVMRRLWTGEFVTFHGRHYTVENARIYTRPAQPPPVYVSAFGPNAIEVAARIGVGFMSTSPVRYGLHRFRSGDGAGKPAQAGYKVCWGRDPDRCIDTAHRLWANSGVPG